MIKKRNIKCVSTTYRKYKNSITMKYFKFFAFFIFSLSLFNCNTIVNGKSNKHPNFKIGKSGLEKNLRKHFDFENLSIGTFSTNKNGVSKEKGLNLTFQKKNLHQTSDSLINVYANKIKKDVVNNLLHLKDYDCINITFESKIIDGDLNKINSIALKKQLK